MTLGYLLKLFAKFNEINLKLQGNVGNLIKAKFLYFISKLIVLKHNIGC